MTTAQFAPTAADVTFVEETHEYFAGLVRIPSVSEILRPITGPALERIPEAILNRKRDIGLAVHMACELIDGGYELDPESLDPDVVPYIEGYRRFLVDMRPLWIAIEETVFDRELWYAGRLDRYGLIGTREWLIDIKTSKELQPSHAVQLTAYRNAYPRAWDAELAVLRLTADGNYKLGIVKEEPETWAALVTLHKFNGGRK